MLPVRPRDEPAGGGGAPATAAPVGVLQRAVETVVSSRVRVVFPTTAAPAEGVPTEPRRLIVMDEIGGDDDIRSITIDLD